MHDPRLLMLFERVGEPLDGGDLPGGRVSLGTELEVYSLTLLLILLLLPMFREDVSSQLPAPCGRACPTITITITSTSPPFRTVSQVSAFHLK